MNPLKNNEATRGFSLVELMVVTALVGFIVLGLSYFLISQGKSSKILAGKSSRDSLEAGLKKSFSQILEPASIAMKFQNLEIPLICTPSGVYTADDVPCVRRQLPGSTEFSGDGSGIPLWPGTKGVEFFRDSNGPFVTVNSAFPQGLQFGGVGTPTPIALTEKLLTTVGMNPNVFQGQNYAVTWPLRDEKSPPLMILQNSRDQTILTFNDISSGSIDANGILFESSSPITPTVLLGQLAVMYNVFDPRHYFFQQITKVTSCQPAPALGDCANILDPQKLANSFLISYQDFTLSPDLFPGAPYVSGNTPMNETYTVLSGSTDPTRYLSSSNKDLRSISHYYHLNGLKSKFVMLLVSGTSFALEKANDVSCPGGIVTDNERPNTTCSHVDLVKRVFPDPQTLGKPPGGQVGYQKTVILSDFLNNVTLAPNKNSPTAPVNYPGRIVFSRMLGTENYELHGYQPNVFVASNDGDFERKIQFTGLDHFSFYVLAELGAP